MRFGHSDLSYLKCLIWNELGQYPIQVHFPRTDEQ